MTVLNAREREEHDRIWSNVRSDNEMFDAALAESALFEAADRRRQMVGSEAVMDHARVALVQRNAAARARKIAAFDAVCVAELEMHDTVRERVAVGDISPETVENLEILFCAMEDIGETLIAERLAEVLQLITAPAASEV